MKNNFQSKAVPRGTRTIWRYLGALFILFTFAIGNVWAAEETITWDGTSLTGVSSTNITAGTALAVAGSDGRKVQTIEVYNSAQIASGGTTRKKYNDGWWENFYSTPCTTSGCTDASTTARIEIPFTIGASKTFEITNVSFDFAQNGGSGPAVHAFLVQGTTEEWLGYKSTSGTCNYTPTDITFESGEAKLVFVLGIGANKLGDNRGFLFSNISITGDVEDSGAGPVAVTAITIAPSSATIKVGKKVTLVPTITPSNATDKAVTWAVTSGSSYASVTDAGVVTGLAVGTAVVTATAHDGSGVTQTATITVEACPTSGTIYKFQLKTDLTNGNLTTSVPQDVVMTTENYLSNLTGGTLTAAARSNVNRINISNGNAIGFANGDQAFLKMDLDCAIQEGDILKYTITSNDMILMAGSETEATNRMTLSRNVAQVEVDSKLVGADALYMKRSSSSPKISYFEVFRPVYNTITLEYADGVTPDGTIKVLDGEAATKPADPTWEHHRFDGWYNGASPYDWSATVEGDLTLTAHWTQLYTITYAAGDGTATGEAPTQVDKAEGETFTVAANTFEVAGKDFVKWNDGSADYDPDDIYTVGTENIVLTAQWKAEADKYTVIFKDGESTLDTKSFEVGTNPSDAGVDKTKALNTFAAWQKDAADIALNDAFWATVVKDATVTLTARWAKAYASNADFEAYIIANKSEKDDADKAEAYVKSLNYALSTKTGTTFDANDETNNGAYAGLKIKNAGTILSWNVVAGKVVELKAGVMVANGSLAINSGTPTTIDGGSTTSGNDNYKIHYFYSATEALYEFTTSNGSAEVIKAITMRDPYTVSFEAHGDADPSALPGQPSVTLPAATNGTASLLGWFDAETGGNKIGDAGDSYTPTANITLHAQWESVSTDARLSAITLSDMSGVWSPAFDPEVVNYTYTMPYGTAAVPTITGATAANAKAQAPVIDAQAAAWGQTAIIRGVAQSGDSKAYNITMLIAPKDGVSIIKVATTGGTNKTVTGLYAGDGDVNLSSSKKMDNGKYIGFTLAGTTLQVGDQINVHTSTAANTGGSHIIFYDNMTDKNELYETGEIGGLGDNIFTINAAMVGQVSAYVYRSNADAAHQWNGYVDFIEVTRAMNPVLTAITFDGVNAEPGVGNTFSALLPNGTNLASMTVTPTIVWNGAGTAAPTAAWAWDTPITFRVTDKDGDYTDYTITLTEDVLKHTVSFNTHGGSAVDAQEVVDGENPVEPIEPTKEDFTFQGWAESDGGAIVDVTSFTITAPKEFHAVWAAETGVIKLLDGEGNINTTDFVTAVSKGTVNFDDADHNCASFGSTASTVVGASGLNKFIIYNAKTDQTKIKFVLYNTNSSTQKLVLQKLAEGGDAVEKIEIDVPSKEEFTTGYYAFNSSLNRTMYAFVKNTNIKVLQVKVVDDGTPVKQFGEVGYSINFNQGRLFLYSGADAAYDGMTYRASSNYAPLTNAGLSITKSRSYSFSVPAAATMTVTASNNAKYYITQTEEGEDNETAVASASSFDLTAGTWYLRVDGSNLSVTNIAFTAPKCEKPVFTSLADIELCEGDPFTAINGAATVSDGGTISYQWYNEDDSEISGAIADSFTPSADGKYYVIATNTLAGFADNFAKSDLVEVKHVASAVITEAPLDQRILEGEDATLTVSATGKNLSYVWYTCDNKAGDNPVAIVPAETNASLTITVTAGLNQYYKVVVSSDCGNAEAVAKIEEWQEVELQDVTGDMAWDFSKSGVTSGTIEGEKVLANIYGVANNAEFRSDNIKANGNKFGNGYIQSAELMFHATVPGLLTVEFSNTGNKTNNRYLIVNGETTNVGINNQTHVTWSGVVPAGDVILTVTEADGGQMFNFFNISFEKIDYARAVNAGRYGTICLPKAGVMKEASLYEVAYKDASKIYFDEILSGEMVAGRPYIFLPNAGAKYIGVAYDDPSASPVAADSYNGLYGYYNLSYLDDADEREHPYNVLIGEYIISNNQYIKVNGNNSYIAQFRAYIKLDEIPGSAPAPAPGIRRIAMGYSGENTATGIDQITNEQLPMINKVIIDGQLFIFRGEKMYDATGRLVK